MNRIINDGFVIYMRVPPTSGRIPDRWCVNAWRINVLRARRLTFNKRKKQKRARTGRRS